MKREILCEKCATKQVPMHPEDVLNGFKRRIVSLRVAKPEGHGIETITIDDKGAKERSFEALPSIVCDHCGEAIRDGENVKAVTWWNTNREVEPGPWEDDYRQ